MDRPPPTVRRATDDDLDDALAVATAALGWDPGEPNAELFRWKHLDNPAGRSPMWVAVDRGAVVGFRTMLRWRFAGPDGREHAAVRAVDTATHPDHQRRGIFRALTTAAVDELRDEGAGFVFNTPNGESRPGYLRLGWRDEGRLAARFTVRGPRALPRLARARVAAAKWSEPLTVGDPVEAALDDLLALAAATAPTDGIATVRSADHLAWRYGFAPLHYRVVRTDDAAAVVRVRTRGPAREGVIAEVFSPGTRSTARLLARLGRTLGTDHLLTLAHPPHPAPWLPTLPGLGPRLTVRDLAEAAPRRDQFRFALGDIELF